VAWDRDHLEVVIEPVALGEGGCDRAGRRLPLSRRNREARSSIDWSNESSDGDETRTPGIKFCICCCPRQVTILVRIVTPLADRRKSHNFAHLDRLE